MPAAGFVSQAGFFGTSEATVSFDRSAGMDYRQVQSPAWREDLADFVGAFHEFAGQFHLVRDLSGSAASAKERLDRVYSWLQQT